MHAPTQHCSPRIRPPRPPARACARMSWSHPCSRRNPRSPIVDLVPNSITTSASRGIGGRPARTRTPPPAPGAADRRRRSSQRDNTGAATFTRPPHDPPAGGNDAASSAGRRSAAGSHGITPKQGQPVCRSMMRTPSSNRRRSPRSLLIRNPRSAPDPRHPAPPRSPPRTRSPARGRCPRPGRPAPPPAARTPCWRCPRRAG